MIKRLLCVAPVMPAAVTHHDRERQFAVVIPELVPFEHACAWCYGRPMAGQETCSRVDCITNWNAVQVAARGWWQ